ncbi:MAG TPA: enoyl-CoA hydratase/isomerase family protein [Candidatus Polarisedimenticolaceae bacterium]|nr:enoyl-CoA hydratase/isomerase family protein [Candidatus Polarisedimenticolaceae bacterium]
MAGTVTLSVDEGLATLRLARAHGNAINGELVADLLDACERIEGDAAIRGVLLAAAGKLFCPGLDLQELSELGREALEAFIARFSACILRLVELPKPVVAAIGGHAVAGGCVLALTADWRVLRRGALIGLNEVQVGVPFPYGVAMLLRESVSAPRREEVALFGRNYRDEEALAAGLAHELHGEEGFERVARARLAELAAKEPRAFSITKRYLRSVLVERMRQHETRLREDFVTSWFAPETRGRVAAIVAELRSRKT